MSLFGSLDTAVSGLTAQAASFSNISDNVANSQTVGFKSTDTAFQDILSTSTALVNDSGDVQALPEYQNTVQGTIAQTQSATNMAISGQGFFPVSIPETVSTTTANATPTFSPVAGYTRAGDFSMNAQGYLVNSGGAYLNGWSYNSSGQVNTSSLSPIIVTPLTNSPVATSTVTLSANLPATPATSGSSAPPYTTEATIYDSVGTAHQITLSWTPNTANPGEWDVSVYSPDDTSGDGTTTAIGTATVDFGRTASGNPVTSGTLGSISAYTGGVTGVSSYSSGGAATMTVQTTFSGAGTQDIVFDLGTFGGTTGLTQFAGTDYAQSALTQNGSPPGQFSSVTTTSSGDVVINYTNGNSEAIARVPIATFDDPNALLRQNAEVFNATTASGTVALQQAGTEGAGTIDTKSTEQSNVDIATEFTKLIVAQQAYSANAKVVTTANTLLQNTLDMKQ